MLPRAPATALSSRPRRGARSPRSRFGLRSHRDPFPLVAQVLGQLAQALHPAAAARTYSAAAKEVSGSRSANIKPTIPPARTRCRIYSRFRTILCLCSLPFFLPRWGEWDSSRCQSPFSLLPMFALRWTIARRAVLVCQMLCFAVEILSLDGRNSFAFVLDAKRQELRAGNSCLLSTLMDFDDSSCKGRRVGGRHQVVG